MFLCLLSGVNVLLFLKLVLNSILLDIFCEEKVFVLLSFTTLKAGICSLLLLLSRSSVGSMTEPKQHMTEVGAAVS